jgi:ADP-heptose:LPS heptosyltransferase
MDSSSPSRPGVEFAEGRPIAILVDRDGLGDVILKLPLVRTIAKHRPGSPIWWLTAYVSTMKSQVLPYVDDMIANVVSDLDFTRSAIQGARALSALPRFEEVFDMRTRVASVLAARIAMRPRKFYHNLPGLTRRPEHVGARALRLAKQAYGSVETGSALAASPSAYRAAAALLPPSNLWVGIAFGSDNVRKNWPLERFITLARQIKSGGLSPVLLVGPSELSALPRLAEEASDIQVVDMTRMDIESPRGRLDAALGLAASLRLLIANDNGIGHLFGAAGVPVVSLFGPTLRERWAPVTPRGVVVRAQDFGGEAIETIPIEAVYQAAMSVIHRTSAEST